jgi:hypothetical protein
MDHDVQLSYLGGFGEFLKFSPLLLSSRLLQHDTTDQGSIHSVKYEAQAARQDVSPSS